MHHRNKMAVNVPIFGESAFGNGSRHRILAYGKAEGQYEPSKKREGSSDMPLHVEVDKMRKRLRQQQKILADQVEVERERIEPKLTANSDRADRAYAYDYRGRRISFLDQLKDHLAEVNKALQRIDEGTYGICTNCGKPIMFERLDALPEAELCIDCQRKES
jgi:RNA polymerase-binding transcription factor